MEHYEGLRAPTQRWPQNGEQPLRTTPASTISIHSLTQSARFAPVPYTYGTIANLGQWRRLLAQLQMEFA
jgi:hypothetical protein